MFRSKLFHDTKKFQGLFLHVILYNQNLPNLCIS